MRYDIKTVAVKYSDGYYYGVDPHLTFRGKRSAKEGEYVLFKGKVVLTTEEFKESPKDYDVIIFTDNPEYVSKGIPKFAPFYTRTNRSDFDVEQAWNAARKYPNISYAEYRENVRIVHAEIKVIPGGEIEVAPFKKEVVIHKLLHAYVPQVQDK